MHPHAALTVGLRVLLVFTVVAGLSAMHTLDHRVHDSSSSVLTSSPVAVDGDTHRPAVSTAAAADDPSPFTNSLGCCAAPASPGDTKTSAHCVSGPTQAAVSVAPPTVCPRHEVLPAARVRAARIPADGVTTARPPSLHVLSISRI